ncbi:hypothetical protein, partial [Mycobacterium szulgai]|uniref:hypothetical protein n=1 Tax=Mycobacterium szulgai TaxID=1787 RepID=UPI0021F3069F
EFFVALPQRFAAIGAVDIQLKDMHAVNELSGHRYEVVLHKEPAAVRSCAQLPTVPWNRWGSLAALGPYLHEERPLGVRVSGVPHRGVSPEVALDQELARAGDRVALHQLRVQPGAVDAAMPAECHRLGRELGYRVVVTWSVTPGLMDVLFLSDEDSVLSDVYVPRQGVSRWVNDPAAIARGGEVRRWVGDRLPEFMVPSVVMVLDGLPLTPN